MCVFGKDVLVIESERFSVFSACMPNKSLLRERIFNSMLPTHFANSFVNDWSVHALEVDSRIAINICIQYVYCFLVVSCCMTFKRIPILCAAVNLHTQTTLP